MSVIKIPGNSSARIDVVKDSNGSLIVQKSCVGDAAIRLSVQAEKQKNFKFLDGVRTPEILRIDQSDQTCKVTMEYVNGLDFVSFTNTCCKNDFLNAIQKLVKLINEEFSTSTRQDFPAKAWSYKANSSIENSGLDKDTKDKLRQELLQNLPDKISMGTCHGDLTFSNCLVEKDGTICIFDFLNSPIETPYEDAAKFLQDAQFFWSLHKFTGSCDPTRIMIYWKFAENLLRLSLKDKCDFSILKKFQILGILRIIPYTQSDNTLKFLTNCVQRLLNDPYSSVCR